MKWISLGVRLVPMVLAAIQKIEMFRTGLKGKEKQEAALSFAGDLLLLVEGVAGKELMDDARMQQALRE